MHRRHAQRSDRLHKQVRTKEELLAALQSVLVLPLGPSRPGEIVNGDEYDERGLLCAVAIPAYIKAVDVISLVQ